MPKTVNIEAEQPLPKRPNLLVIIHPGTGRRHILGDGRPLNQHEYRAIYPPQPRATDPLEGYLSDAERQELADAEQRLERAKAEAERMRSEILARARAGAPLDLSEPDEIEKAARRERNRLHKLYTDRASERRTPRRLHVNERERRRQRIQGGSNDAA